MIRKKSTQALGVVQVFLAALLWGTAGTFAKYLFNSQISPFDLAQARITISFLFLVLTLAVIDRNLLRVSPRDIPYLMVYGIFGLAFNQFAYLFTISLTNVATAIFLQYLAPALMLIYGLMMKVEKPSILKFLAVGASILGGYLIVLGTSTGLGLSTLGLISGLLSAVLFAFYSIYGKRGLVKYNSWTLLTWGFGFGSLVWTLYQLPWMPLINNPHSIGQFLYVAIFASVIPFGLYLKGLQKLSAFKAGLIATLEPVIGAFSAFIFLKEVLNGMQILGCAFILIGIILVQFKNVNK
ncbi:MAG TPA: EamA family transporter [Peptococcaceae bacterium]|nr:EamA family transporter [Peptococcaceae bacterium]